MTQRETIANHLILFGSITDKEAEDKYGIRRTSARIWELKRYDGFLIDTTMIAVKNRYGKTRHVARYDYRGRVA